MESTAVVKFSGVSIRYASSRYITSASLFASLTPAREVLSSCLSSTVQKGKLAGCRKLCLFLRTRIINSARKRRRRMKMTTVTKMVAGGTLRTDSLLGGCKVESDQKE
ncbi:hypothetical protein HOLleu_15996 [Holothuria leucospilota]|uniref:Uncharacterized protein n=1 Tax=Holothuria leucospilota TaxID=206669 RepID=A0A9Q1C4Z7_HOLLE|nr:hypothetical protein HOLleu_15996 [Holothuria leucospilota]